MTWDEIGAAIERARLNVDQRCHDLHDGGTRSWNCYCVNEREALLDVLAAIHQIHRPETALTEEDCHRSGCCSGGCEVNYCGGCGALTDDGSCPSEQVVIDALTRMGALREANDETD